MRKSNKPRSKKPKNALAEKKVEGVAQFFQRGPGKFGSKIVNDSAVGTVPEPGRYIIETELGAVVRPGSSAPAHRRPRYKAPTAAPEFSQFEAGEVPRNYWEDRYWASREKDSDRERRRPRAGGLLRTITAAPLIRSRRKRERRGLKRRRLLVKQNAKPTRGSRRSLTIHPVILTRSTGSCRQCSWSPALSPV
jgi:hypothetical protein